jgi:hypothetical protein
VNFEIIEETRPERLPACLNYFSIKVFFENAITLLVNLLDLVLNSQSTVRLLAAGLAQFLDDFVVRNPFS